MRIAVLLLVFMGAATAAVACGDDAGSGTGAAVATDVYLSQEPVSGPPVGVSGNDSDNSFSSLTVSPSNPDVVYLGSEGNGIFRSRDGGESWQWLRQGLKYLVETEEPAYPEVYDIVIDPANEAIVYAATTLGPGPAAGEGYPSVFAGVYKSLNAGDSWTQINQGLPNSAANSLAMSPIDHNTLYVGLDGEAPTFIRDDGGQPQRVPGGMYWSSDAGASWQPVPVPGRGIKNRFIRVIFRGSDRKPVLFASATAWAGGGAEPYRPDDEAALGLIMSRDQGLHWWKINPPGAFVQYFDVSADGETIYANDLNTSTIFRSADAGSGWEQLEVYASGPIAVSPADPGIVIFSSGKSVSRSEDGLATWRKLRDVDNSISDIVFAPADPAIVYMSTAGLQLYKSIDGGRSFTYYANLRDLIESGS